MTSSRVTGAENSSADSAIPEQISRRSPEDSGQRHAEPGRRGGTSGATGSEDPGSDATASGSTAPDPAAVPTASGPTAPDPAAVPTASGPTAPDPATSGSADTGDVLAASVARVRRAAGLTLSAVAARAGVSPAYVSQVESGTANPTVRTLSQIADALGVTPAELLGGTPPGTAVTAPAPGFPPRFAPAPLLARTDGHHGIWDLTAPGAHRIGARLLHADLGDHDHPTAHSGEEFVLVLAGSCRVSVAGTVRLLRPADSCHFAATDEHHFTDASDDLLMLVVLTEE
ncbi:XRE family transcriptional regulator [Streptomyces sp. Amel2xC10]|uniref:XRE family transcriptional regulator n=1 Tax=Streptomyces sp. Amel2xC10 TaxID=1305826 RepID=UPI000A0900EE|nr:XRE family transcriptional regulator [Streptomyces sp. Amel2xC10]SMF78502.1 transcriptional regulator, XRE family with cupin sensor [Streptomyces sp. Amel2xC10]